MTFNTEVAEQAEPSTSLDFSPWTLSPLCLNPDSKLGSASFRPKAGLASMLGDEDQGLRNGGKDPASISSFWGWPPSGLIRDGTGRWRPSVMVESWRDLGPLNAVRERLPFASLRPTAT